MRADSSASVIVTGSGAGFWETYVEGYRVGGKTATSQTLPRMEPAMPRKRTHCFFIRQPPF